MSETYLWFVFVAVFLVLFSIDMGVLNRKDHSLGTGRAVKMVAFYVLAALLFGVLIYYELGSDYAVPYYAAYLIELSMSVDNLFVFIVIFSAFAIPSDKQHKVLYWGIMGAILFRAVFIFAGAELLSNFHIMMYVFGVILIYTAYKTAFSKDDDDEGDQNTLAFRLSRRIHATSDVSSGKFFVIEGAKRVATPLFLCLVVIEISDVMFAFDSIPAALSISTDMFIVYASNIFAVMGLRSLYFVIKDIIGSLAYLKYGLGVILAFIGLKMLLSASGVLVIDVIQSLLFIVLVLAVTVFASILHGRRTGDGA